MLYTISNKNTAVRWGLKGDERIVQNVLNLIRTRKHEVPFMRELGVDPDIIDNELPFLQSMITEEIRELVAEYENRASVKEVNFTDVDENGNLVYEVIIEV